MTKDLDMCATSWLNSLNCYLATRSVKKQRIKKNHLKTDRNHYESMYHNKCIFNRIIKYSETRTLRPCSHTFGLIQRLLESQMTAQMFH